MISLQGTPRTLCDGLIRRDFLQLGGLAAFGLGLDGYLRHAAAASTGSFGKAKSCILLFPYGSPPQHETFDPKPDAPAEIQGELKASATSVPGLRICEGLPHIAPLMDRVCVVRSVTHPYPVHGVAYAVSGIPTYTPELETRARDGRHWPFIGSIVDHVEAKKQRGRLPAVPRNVALPWVLNSKTDILVNAGPYAAFLGQQHDPVWTDFDGAGLHEVPPYSADSPKRFRDPYGATTREGRFRLSALDRAASERLPQRVGLLEQLEQFEQARRTAERSAAEGLFDRQQQQALALLTSSKMRDALDVGREPLKLRESYGMTLFGQACLAARRLVEAGCKFITVFWDGFGSFGGCAWDTHSNHYPRLKEYLLPGFDLAYAGLLRDLESRGLLDETLVLWLSEHGRTPKIDSKPKGAGRHHWSRAYSVALAGGGAARGKVVGSTDRQGGDVRDTPVSPKDLLATAFHLLGIDPHTTVADAQGRPFPVAGDGQLRSELVG